MASETRQDKPLADTRPTEPTAKDVDKETSASEPSIARASISKWIPDWVSDNIRSSRSWRLLFRCWVASWAAVVILLPGKSLNKLGSTAFFALLASTFFPPIFPLQMLLIVILTLMLGVLSGWGIGSAAMRAALAARDPALLQRQMKAVAASANGTANLPAVFTAATLSGAFLDTRSTVVYGCFLAFGTAIFGLIRALYPKLLALSIFGTIAIDIFCSIGPLFPTPRYMILNSLLISVSCYVAIAIFATIFIFPETMNHSYLTTTAGLLGCLRNMVLVQDEVLAMDLDVLRDETKNGGMPERIRKTRIEIIAKMQGLMATSRLINLEFTWGRWNGGDVRGLEDPLLAVVTRAAFLELFVRLVAPREIPSPHTKLDSDPSSVHTSGVVTSDTYILHQLRLRDHAREETGVIRIRDIMPLVRDCTAELRSACAEGLATAQALIQSLTKWRWTVNEAEDAEHAKALDDSISRLSAAVTQFKENQLRVIVGPYTPILETARTWSQEKGDPPPLLSLYVAYTFVSNQLILAYAITSLLETIRSTARKRTKIKLWAPKGLRALGRLFTGHRDKTDTAFGDEAPPDSAEDEEELGPSKRDPDSRPPENAMQKVMDVIHKLWKWMRTAEAWFTFKYVFLTIALWVPAVVHKSAKLYYDQKGVWALIMAQTTLNIFAADQIYNLVTRLIGTFVGLVLGLAAWYIGSGDSLGNPYGLAASTAVFLVPVVFLRIFVPLKHQIGVILLAITFALIVGYSWIDSHIVQPVSPGVGWSVAWKRWALVVIGSGASFIMMIFPPISARKAVRLRNASTIRCLSTLYSFLMSAWITAGSIDERAHLLSAWRRKFRSRLVGLIEEIQDSQQRTELARWEGNLRGHWPAEEYAKLEMTQLQMVSSLGQLGAALSHLEEDWRLAFLPDTRILNPNLIRDVVAVFALISQCLRIGEPLHEATPYPIVERVFRHHHKPVSAKNENQRSPHDFDELTSPNFVYFAAALVSVFQLLEGLDELHCIVKTLCGEVPLSGFELWQKEYEKIQRSV